MIHLYVLSLLYHSAVAVQPVLQAPSAFLAQSELRIDLVLLVWSYTSTLRNESVASRSRPPNGGFHRGFLYPGPAIMIQLYVTRYMRYSSDKFLSGLGTSIPEDSLPGISP
jgi:hypothetical protein